MNEASKMSKMLEDKISEALIKAVQNLSIEIDEEELLKRLRDSKKQYRSGYNDRDSEIVRCKDCVHWISGTITDKDDFIQPRCKRNGGVWSSDEYCSCAEKRTDEI